jgi:hypothetical protein
MFGRGSRLHTWGSEEGLRGLIRTAVASSPRGRGVARAVWPPVAALIWHAISFGNRLGHRSTPLSAGRLRMHPAY